MSANTIEQLKSPPSVHGGLRPLSAEGASHDGNSKG